MKENKYVLEALSNPTHFIKSPLCQGHLVCVTLYVLGERSKKRSLFILMCLSVAGVLEWP